MPLPPGLSEVRRFRELLAERTLLIPVDDSIDISDVGPLWRPVRMGPHVAGNRLCVQPIEGWDADSSGLPTDSTIRRWETLGRSGAKTLWTESVAVDDLSRSSLSQLVVHPSHTSALAELRQSLVTAHYERFGRTDDLVVGVQLHHSGRMTVDSVGRRTPITTHAHPILDSKYKHHLHQDENGFVPLVADSVLDELPGRYAAAAITLREAGFGLVDIKACHGYLLHESLGAHSRPGPYGGSFSNRTRLLLAIVTAVRRSVPDVALAVRLSAFDLAPPVVTAYGSSDHVSPWPGPYPYTFGSAADGSEIDLGEPLRLVQLLVDLGVDVVNVSGGSPYVSWHAQRPAQLPNAGDYPSPEDPLIGVARHLAVTSEIRRAVPSVTVVGSAYSYLHQFFPHVAQAAVRSGLTDVVGFARLHLLAPTLAADCRTGVAALDPRTF